MTLRAMVLAAGRGVRMQPLTAARAKPSLPVLGVSLVGRVVRHLSACGVEAAAVNAYHGAESLAEVLERDAPGLATVFRERELMGTAGGLDAPRGLLEASDPFVLHNGDTLVKAPVGALVEAATQPGVVGALLVRRPADPRYTPVLSENGRFCGLAPEADPVADTRTGTYLGVAALRGEVLDRVPSGVPSELFRDVLLPLHAERPGCLAVVSCREPWLEFTDPLSYARTLRHLARWGAEGGKVMLPGGDAAISKSGDAIIYLHPTARVDTSHLEGTVIVESGARVARGARLKNVIVLENASIPAGAHIRNAVVSGTADGGDLGVTSVALETEECP